MKKLMILLAVACLVCVSCGPRTEKATEPAQESCCSLTPEQVAMFENWELWAELEEGQQELVCEMKAFLDECIAQYKEKKEKCEPKEGEEVKEVCPEKAAKCAEFKAKWEAFETLTLEEQKELLDQKLACIKAKCCKEKGEGCKKEGEGCKKDKETCEKE